MSTQLTTEEQHDINEVWRLHRDWMEANRQQSTPLMRQTFVGGDKFHGFNLNGHEYVTIEEWATLWDTFNPDLKMTNVETSNERIVMKGNVGWVTYDGTLTLKATRPHGAGIAKDTHIPFGEDGTLTVPFHGTDVCVKEDENGEPNWKMWHFHCSPQAPAGSRKPGF